MFTLFFNFTHGRHGSCLNSLLTATWSLLSSFLPCFFWLNVLYICMVELQLHVMFTVLHHRKLKDICYKCSYLYCLHGHCYNPSIYISKHNEPTNVTVHWWSIHDDQWRDNHLLPESYALIEFGRKLGCRRYVRYMPGLVVYYAMTWCFDIVLEPRNACHVS